MVYLFNIAAFLFAAFPYALLPFIVLKIIEVQNHADDVIAFEAERVIVHALTAGRKDNRIIMMPRRRWLVTGLLAALASLCFQTINAATTAKLTISAVVVLTCKIFVSTVHGEKVKVKSACDSPATRADEPVMSTDEQHKEITVSY